MAQKKTQGLLLEQKRGLIEPTHPTLSISSQCALIGLPRSSFYYEICEESEFIIKAMHAIDRIYTERPYYGKRRMSIRLKELGLNVGRELARSLMIRMGLEAEGPKPNLSKPHPMHKVYPYGLRELVVFRPNQVWSSDITYIPLTGGFLYLTAIIDWFSRRVLSWKLSNSLDGLFCREVLIEALEKYGVPEWFNTDQGVQYTAVQFIEILEKAGIKISMNGKMRALDNVFCERLWRTIKYEDVYLKSYETGKALHKGLGAYILYYNEERPHSSLRYLRPIEVYGNPHLLTNYKNEKKVEDKK
ncbi:MAG: IS3 family transposase [Chlamydiia bacterium]|nr:IS3 family transposase [Chlamydiia bacterium]